MSQLDFDFESFHERVTKQREADEREARDGLKKLETEHHDLVTQRVTLDKQIDGLETKIHEIRVFLGIEQQKETKAPIFRDRGVLKALRQIVPPKFEAIDFAMPQAIEDIVGAVHEIKPTAKESSVRDALRALVKEGTLEVTGTRQNRRWMYPSQMFETPVAPVVPGEHSEPSEEGQGTEEPSEAPESTETAPTPPTRPHDEIVRAVVEHIMNSIPKAKDGIGAKTIAWIMGEAGADEMHFEAAVEKLQSEGKVEVGQSLTDDSTVIRFPAEPDSTEELKRTRVTGNPLFPDMEQPSHA